MPMFRITEMKDGNPFSTVELDRESRKYINVRLKHVKKVYDAYDEMEIVDTYYDLN